MNQKDFDVILEDVIKNIREILGNKGIEYSSDKDRLYNFRRCADILHITNERALLGFAMKHFISILDMIEGLPDKIPSKERIDEKCHDMINYLILLKALLSERIKKE
jgi:hypothetical protein